MTIGRLMILAAILVRGSDRAWSHEHRIGSLEIVHPWAQATKVSEGDKCALLMTVINNGDLADRLIGVSTPLGDDVVVHLHSSDGQSDREKVTSGIDLPAGVGDRAPKKGSDSISVQVARPAQAAPRRRARRRSSLARPYI